MHRRARRVQQPVHTIVPALHQGAVARRTRKPLRRLLTNVVWKVAHRVVRQPSDLADREAVAEAKRLAEEGAEATSTATEEVATEEGATTENTSDTQAEKPEEVSPAASE